MNFWDNVEKTLRDQDQLTYGWQKKLAQVSNIAYTTLASQYQKNIDPKTSDAVRIARALGTTVEELVGDLPAKRTPRPTVAKKYQEKQARDATPEAQEPAPVYDATDWVRFSKLDTAAGPGILPETCPSEYYLVDPAELPRGVSPRTHAVMRAACHAAKRSRIVFRLFMPACFMVLPPAGHM